MDDGSIKFRELSTGELPWELLLEADPSREQIERYLPGSIVIGLFEQEHILGVLVLKRTAEEAMEILNIAVDAHYRGQGLGRRLLAHAITQAKDAGASVLEIGTGNSSFNQLRLYQSMGFRIVGVDRDFFTRNYSVPIEENGIRCLDMIRLSLDLL